MLGRGKPWPNQGEFQRYGTESVWAAKGQMPTIFWLGSSAAAGRVSMKCSNNRKERRIHGAVQRHSVRIRICTSGNIENHTGIMRSHPFGKEMRGNVQVWKEMKGNVREFKGV